MDFGPFSKRFARVSFWLPVLLFTQPSFADSSSPSLPLGYTGPVPSAASAMPVGYTGPVPTLTPAPSPGSSSSASGDVSSAVPPLGYTGPVATDQSHRRPILPPPPPEATTTAGAPAVSLVPASHTPTQSSSISSSPLSVISSRPEVLHAPAFTPSGSSSASNAFASGAPPLGYTGPAPTLTANQPAMVPPTAAVPSLAASSSSLSSTSLTSSAVSSAALSSAPVGRKNRPSLVSDPDTVPDPSDVSSPVTVLALPSQSRPPLPPSSTQLLAPEPAVPGAGMLSQSGRPALLLTAPKNASSSLSSDVPHYTGVAAASAGFLPPPLGYVGPVPVENGGFRPPVGYVGPVPHALASAFSQTDPKAALAAAALAAEATAHMGETLITAEQMHSDTNTNIVTATGKVEIVHNDYVLHADKVSYDQNTGIMTADGHVSMLTPTGDVEFSSHEQITGDMKQAFARNLGVLFPDNSRMAALTAVRYDERYTVANKGAYTACNVCVTDPDQAPSWQLHAETITHDNEEHKIYYHDAVVSFDGVPAVYTPYLSTPDPTVKRLQGFLSPTPGYSTNIGAYLKIPYYFDIAPDIDATVTPTFSATDKLQMAGQYRERFAKGALSMEGSVTRADLLDDYGVNKGEKWRGDLFGSALFDINSTWRVGTDIQYASDKSYLPRYDISSLDQTTSRAYIEGFQGRDYAALNSYYFRDLRPGVDVSEPLVLPSATFSALGDPGDTLGGRWSFDGNTLITTRNNSNQSVIQQGPDTRRVSTNTGWQRQFISDTGLETTLSGLFRTDSYWADNIVATDNNQVYNAALFTRQFEQANAVLRYPMGRSGDGYQQLLEPIVSLTGAPDVRKIAEQPNEDSLDVDFDETNLFSPNRFTGSDLIEGGSRVTYGLRNALTADNGARIDIFGGESYDFTANSDFPELSGLNEHSSDYVGRIDFAPVPWFNANYGFRLSENDFSPQRQDALVSVGAPIFRPSIRYIEAYETDVNNAGLTEQVQEAILGLSSTFAKYYSINAGHTQGFDPQPGPRSSSISFNYVDECIAMGITVSHDDTNRLDISSGTSASFHLFLKNLGGIHTDSATNIQYPAQFRQTEQTSTAAN